MNTIKYAIAFTLFAASSLAFVYSLQTRVQTQTLQRAQINWTFSGHPYMGEGFRMRPVVVTSVKTEAETFTVTAVRLNNISSKTVRAVKLAWNLDESQARDVVLHNGETGLVPIKGGLATGQSIVVELPLVSLSDVRQRLVEKGLAGGKFSVRVAVSEITFVDETKWKVGDKVDIVDASLSAKIVKIGFEKGASRLMVTPLAKTSYYPKQQCNFESGPPPGYSCTSSDDDEFCTNCVVTCCNTICGQQPACDCN